jgi:hypothetical protein
LHESSTVFPVFLLTDREQWNILAKPFGSLLTGLCGLKHSTKNHCDIKNLESGVLLKHTAPGPDSTVALQNSFFAGAAWIAGETATTIANVNNKPFTLISPNKNRNNFPAKIVKHTYIYFAINCLKICWERERINYKKHA